MAARALLLLTALLLVAPAAAQETPPPPSLQPALGEALARARARDGGLPALLGEQRLVAADGATVTLEVAKGPPEAPAGSLWCRMTFAAPPGTMRREVTRSAYLLDPRGEVSRLEVEVVRGRERTRVRGTVEGDRLTLEVEEARGEQVETRREGREWFSQQTLPFGAALALLPRLAPADLSGSLRGLRLWYGPALGHEYGRVVVERGDEGATVRIEPEDDPARATVVTVKPNGAIREARLQGALRLTPAASPPSRR